MRNIRLGLINGRLEATAIAYQPGNAAMNGWTTGNGLPTTLSWDASGRLAGIAVPGVQALSFSHDRGNRITAIGHGYDSAMNQTLRYDAMDRLTQVSAPAHVASYRYDANGNRISQVLNGRSTHFSYVAHSNQLLRATGGIQARYGYSATGSTTTVNGQPRYHYNAFGRLTQAEGARYLLSGEGERLQKTYAGQTTRFAPKAGGMIWAESRNDQWRDYVWLNGRLIALIDHGQLYAVHTDQVNRPVAITNSHRQIVWKARGLPFDRQQTSNQFGDMNIGFPGQYQDDETGLWYNGHRDYDASLGRYIQSDPIGLAGGVNTYAYVKDNPVNLVDYTGLMANVICNGTNVAIEIYLSFHGDAASIKNIDNIINSIESGWTGDFGKWHVTTTIHKVRIAPSAYNSINLINGPVRSNAKNWLFRVCCG